MLAERGLGVALCQPAAQVRHRQQGLEAAASRAGAALAVGVDDHVADLTGGRAVAVQQGALEHEAGTDTRAHADHHQPAVAGVAEGVLAEHRSVGVVGDEDRQPEGVAQSCRQRHVRPAEVGSGDDGAFGVHDAGAAHADPEHRPVRQADQLGGQPMHDAPRRRRP